MDTNPMPIKTAKWPTLIAIILALGVVFSETSIIKIANHSESIPLYALQSEDEGNETDEALKSIIDENTQQIVDVIFQHLNDLDFTKEDVNTAFSNHQLTQSKFKIAISQLGNQFYQAKLYSKAEIVIGILNKNERMQLGVQFKYANAQSQQSKNKLAIESYNELIKAEPNHQAATINLGLLLNETEQYNSAIEIFSKAIEITSSKRKAKSYSGLGMAYFNLQQFEKSVAAFKKSIEYRPKNAATWRRLAASMNLSNHSAKLTNETYIKALSLSDKNYRLHNEYGLFLLSKLKFKNSTEQFKIAQKLAKSAAEIRLNLALSYLERGRYKDARKQLSWIVRKKKQFSQHALSKALYSFSKKDFASATEQLDIIKLTSPNNLMIEYYQARILSLTKQKLQAIGKFTLIKSDRQWQYLADLRRSRDLSSHKEYSQSLSIINTLLADTLNIETLLYQKSNLLKLSGDNEKALAAITLAYQASKTSPKMTLRYASLLHLNGKSDEAITTLQNLLEINSQFMRGRELLAEIYLDTGSTEQAIEQYQNAIANESNNTKVKFKLATILVDNKFYSQANIVLNELLLQKSKNVKARILLAQSMFLNSEINQSLDEINLALKLDPQNVAANNLKTTIMENQ